MSNVVGITIRTRDFVNTMFIIGVKRVLVVFYHEGKRIRSFINDGNLMFFINLDGLVMFSLIINFYKKHFGLKRMKASCSLVLEFIQCDICVFSNKSYGVLIRDFLDSAT